MANSIEQMQKICRNLWKSSTYTSFAMYQYLLMLDGQTIGENIANPLFDKDAMIEAIDRAPLEELERLWWRRIMHLMVYNPSPTEIHTANISTETRGTVIVMRET
jgi:hypothetical protein